MFKTLIRVAAICLMVIASHSAESQSATSSGTAPSSDQVIIDGVTNFLADRAQANAEYIFQLQLQKNKSLQCYLPATYKALQDSELILLLKTSSQIWRSRLEEDLKFSTITLLLRYYESSISSGGSTLLSSGLVNGTRYPISVPNSIHDLTSILAQDKNMKQRLDEFVADLEQIRSTLNDSKFSECSFQNDQKLGAIIGYILTSIEHPQAQHKLVDNKYSYASISLKMARTILDLYKSMQDSVSVKNGKYSTYSSAAVDLIGLIHDLCDQSQRNECDAVKVLDIGASDYKLEDEDVMDSIQPDKPVPGWVASLHHVDAYILFFSSLADAKTSDQVTTILQNFMMPPVSFGEIRMHNHISLAAYVGAVYTVWYKPLVSTNSSTPPVGLGLFAPIGVQFSTPCSGKSHILSPSSWVKLCPDGWSASVMFSPFDFGYPLDLKLKGANNANVTWVDVINPSVSLAFGHPEMPLNIGLAYQRVNKSPNNPNPENRLMLFASFDMPLYILH